MSQALPEIQEWRIVKKTNEAVYPLVHRYIVIVRFDTKKIEYIFHEKEGVVSYIEETLLEENLPARNT